MERSQSRRLVTHLPPQGWATPSGMTPWELEGRGLGVWLSGSSMPLRVSSTSGWLFSLDDDKAPMRRAGNAKLQNSGPVYEAPLDLLVLTP